MSHRQSPNKMVLNATPDELKYLEKLEKVLICKRIIFKKIPIMHGKVNLLKLR